MSEKKEPQLKFRIHRIETLQFAILRHEIIVDKLAYAVNFSYGINAESLLVRSEFRYELLSEDKLSLLIEVAIDFNIEQICWEREISKNGKFHIPKDFAKHLAMISVGTARGILHEKTKDTNLNNFPIPTINVEHTITKDILFGDE